MHRPTTPTHRRHRRRQHRRHHRHPIAHTSSARTHARTHVTREPSTVRARIRRRRRTRNKPRRYAIERRPSPRRRVARESRESRASRAWAIGVCTPTPRPACVPTRRPITTHTRRMSDRVVDRAPRPRASRRTLRPLNARRRSRCLLFPWCDDARAMLSRSGFARMVIRAPRDCARLRAWGAHGRAPIGRG